MHFRSSMPRAGFSLPEVLLVVVLLGMIAGAVAVQLDGPLRKARVINATERWLAIDQFVRSSTVHRSATLTIRRSDDRWEAIATRHSGDAFGHWQFDPRIDLEIMRQSRGETLNESQNSERIVFEPGRGTSDYSVQIKDKGIRRVLLIAGGTGEAKGM